jgi:hypothetical protein
MSQALVTPDQNLSYFLPFYRWNIPDPQKKYYDGANRITSLTERLVIFSARLRCDQTPSVASTVLPFSLSFHVLSGAVTVRHQFQYKMKPGMMGKVPDIIAAWNGFAANAPQVSHQQKIEGEGMPATVFCRLNMTD